MEREQLHCKVGCRTSLLDVSEGRCFDCALSKLASRVEAVGLSWLAASYARDESAPSKAVANVFPNYVKTFFAVTLKTNQAVPDVPKGSILRVNPQSLQPGEACSVTDPSTLKASILIGLKTSS